MGVALRELPGRVDTRGREPDRAGSYLGLSKSGFHRLAYVEWGDPRSERVAICVHGLSRQGRDFDFLAMDLADRGWRVVCPDLVGRGRSDWLSNPQGYSMARYVKDLSTLIARLDVPSVDWIGTSLGGLVGILAAAQPHTPVRRLVVNDIGPFVSWQVLQRLRDRVREAPLVFPDLASATAHFRHTLPGFGNLSDAQWEHLARYSVAANADGTLAKLADSEVAGPGRTNLMFNLSLWKYWDQISCPTLVLRGAESDVLIPETAQEMTRRGPCASLVRIPGCGHAPALMDPHQIETVADWLESRNPHAAGGTA